MIVHKYIQYVETRFEYNCWLREYHHSMKVQVLGINHNQTLVISFPIDPALHKILKTVFYGGKLALYNYYI